MASRVGDCASLQEARPCETAAHERDRAPCTRESCVESGIVRAS